MIQVSASTLFAGFATIFTACFLFSMFGKPKWSPRGQRCYVTGGTAGLGLELAVQLVKAGAHVSVVARNLERLEAARNILEAARQSESQVLRVHSFSLTDATASAAALEAVCNDHDGKSPDAIFTCAGSSTPGYWVEETEESIRRGLDNTYFVQAWTALAAAKRYARTGEKGKIVFVSSVLGLMSFVGYGTYAPGKHALKGLAETLRSEMILYGVCVHIYFPGTIFSPGYEAEGATKPALTKKIEETDGGMTPSQSAAALLVGISKGHFHITPDFVTSLFRGGSKGASPGNSLLDVFYGLISWIALPVWRQGVDSSIRGYRREHDEYLVQRGIKSTA